MIEINIKFNPENGQISAGWTDSVPTVIIVGAIEMTKTLIQNRQVKDTTKPSSLVIPSLKLTT